MRDLAPCCICGSSERRLVYPSTLTGAEAHPVVNPYSGHYQINACRGCGLFYSSPILDEVDVQRLYVDYSEANVTDDEIPNVATTMAGYYALARPFLAGRQRFLDIGCDIGLLLQVARNDGFEEIHGLEPVAVARQKAIARVPDAVLSDAFHQDAAFSDAFFDAVALIHVVDHLVRPDEILDRVLRQLKPGGICVAVVHDVDSPLARKLGEKFPVFNFFHHYFFSKQSLAALFKARGYNVHKVGPTKNTYSLAFFIERVPFLPLWLRQTMARVSRWLWVGRIPLSIPIGNIFIVAGKPKANQAN